MIDIESIVESKDVVNENTEDVESAERQIIKNKRVKTTETTNHDLPVNDTDTSHLPGYQKIYIKTWGCSHNTSEGEYMAGLLEKYGYTMVDDPNVADLWILNSCTVKNPSEDAVRNMINKSMEVELGEDAKSVDPSKKSIPVVVTGCVPKADRKMKYMKGVSVLATDNVQQIVHVVEETLKGNQVLIYPSGAANSKTTNGTNVNERPSLDLPKVRRNELIEIIAISTGCLNQCTYCKTKYARGDLGSYSIEEIINRAKQAIEEGVVEIWLTSEDVGAYGRDIGTNIVELLNALVAIVPSYLMIRIGMTNPPYILDHLKDFTELLKHKNVYSFLHIPIQSASDAVLTDMNREYDCASFCNIVDYVLKEIPYATIATDVICAFPTETEMDFKETMNLVEKYKFKVLFTNQYYPRPGTPAAKMKRIPGPIAKGRTAALSKYFLTYLPYENRVGHTYKVLVTEKKQQDDKFYYVGHNKYYEQIQIIDQNTDILGKWVQVKITDYTKFCMISNSTKPINVNSLAYSQYCDWLFTDDIIQKTIVHTIQNVLLELSHVVISGLFL